MRDETHGEWAEGERVEAGVMDAISRLRHAMKHYECVYAIWDGSCVKIGKTRGLIQKRIKELQTGSSRSIKPLLEVRVPCGAKEAEAWSHRRLRDKRAAGEWFRCTKREAADTLLLATFPNDGRVVVWNYKGGCD